MTLASLASLASIVADVDVDRVTDFIGIPLAALLVGLLVLIDLGEIDGGELRIPAVLTNRRALVVASVVVGVALLTVIGIRIEAVAR